MKTRATRRRSGRLGRHEQLEPRLLLAGDLVAQWTADDLNASLPIGGLVSEWTDSASGIVATGNGRPQLVPDALNGRSVIRFDPTDGADSFHVDRLANPLSEANDFSVIVVFRTSATDLHGGNQRWDDNTGLIDGTLKGFGHDWGLSMNAAGQLASGMSGGFGSTPKTVYSAEFGLNEGGIHTAIVTRRGGNLAMYVDGGPPTSRDDADASARSRFAMTFGVLASGEHPYAGDIAQVRIYDGALVSEEVNTIHSDIQRYYQNALPVAVNDAYDTSEDVPLTVTAADGILRNDTDADEDQLAATLVNQPRHGTLAMNPDGSFVYTPDADFHGADAFDYTASDFRPSATATVSLTVRPAYDRPRPTGDAYRLRPDEVLSVDAAGGLLSNDSNPDGVPLRAILDGAQNGLATVNPDGSFQYDPHGFTGATSFTYRVDDGTGLTDPVNVSLIVNSPPVANDDLYHVDEDSTLSVLAEVGLQANDLDAEMNAMVVDLIDGPQHGMLELNENGAFAYTPSENFSGDDRFTYSVSDPFDSSEPATVHVTVRPINDAPVTQADSYFAAPSETLVVSVNHGLLNNDRDIERQALSATVSQAPRHGSLELNADGSFSYSPMPDYVGEDSFTYRATDSADSSTETLVTLRVVAAPIIISELMASNSSGLTTRVRWPDEPFMGSPRTYDWIELRNLLPRPIDIGGLHLTDDPGDLVKWQIPSGTVVSPNGYLVVVASGHDILDPMFDENGLLHTNFRLRSDGEYLAVSDQSGQIVHEYGPAFPRQVADVSFGMEGVQPRYFPSPTPGADNSEGVTGISSDVTFNTQHGFFDDPFQLMMITDDAEAEILYTLDGSEPAQDNGSIYGGPITIDRTTTLRAAAFRERYLPSKIQTATYLFLADILTQSPNGETPSGWPDAELRVNGQFFDYGLDPEIVNSPVWGPQMRDALTQIPSLSIVTDLDNLFDPDFGIYVNAIEDGIEWERPTSVELINPGDGEGFQAGAGLRIRGGFSRGGGNPKHSFRLFFRNAYGDATLRYPLFGDEGVDEFQQIDLRTAQNNAWNNGSNRNSFVRDIFSRDAQRDMDQPYKRGRYYHLYLNGQYWGLYQTDERSEADFSTSYLGGNEDDYDVVKAADGVTDATDGTLDKWNELWRLATIGFETDEQYYAVQGLSADGNDDPNIERHIDIDNLIDYMILIYYTGNVDAPTKSFGINNFFAVRNRKSRDGWVFLAHDSETSMASIVGNNTVPTTIGELRQHFNPKWLSQRLAAHPAYRLRFADRLQKHLFNDGALTPENTAARIQSRADEFDSAMIAESARWGDLTRRLYTKDDWQREVDWLVDRFAPERHEVILKQMRTQGLFPTTQAPTLNPLGGQVAPGHVLELSAEGSIYYTLDGTDPRLPGGAVNPNAIRYPDDGPIQLWMDTVVNARVLNGDEWSALTPATFQVGNFVDATRLRITEIHYNPADPSDGEVSAGFANNDDFEFIEFINTSDQDMDLAGAELVQATVGQDVHGLRFDFSGGDVTRLRPGERVLVVENVAAFNFRYGPGLPVAGQWSGGLGNGGELITLQLAGQTLQQFAYDDAWHPSTDGRGASLEIVDADHPDLDQWQIQDGWMPSVQMGGTPGHPAVQPGDANLDGVFDQADLLLVLEAGEYEDQITDNSTFAEGDWNGDGDFDSADLVLAFERGDFALAARDAVFSSLNSQLAAGAVIRQPLARA